MKKSLLGLTFVIAGAGFISMNELVGEMFIAGIVLIIIGLFISVISTYEKKENR